MFKFYDKLMEGLATFMDEIVRAVGRALLVLLDGLMKAFGPLGKHLDEVYRSKLLLGVVYGLTFWGVIYLVWG